ncbi:glycosyltransferase [Candidatus Micrarchaeota archaeon]|nr:glycosyltransferase [Candidatus Micrarchaeota archaeon]
MRIAFFTDTYLPNIDGIVYSIINFRRELEKRGNKVFIFSSGKKEVDDSAVFFYRSVPFAPYPQYKIALFPFSAKREVAKKEVKLIHSHGFASMGIASIKVAHDLKLPLVGTFHTLAPQAVHLVASKRWSRKIASQLAWRAVKEFYKPFDVVTTPTDTIKNLLEEHGIKNVVTVPNGVDVDRFSDSLDKTVARKLLRIPEEERIVLIAGRLSEEKNVDAIIRAAKKLLKKANVRFVVTGEGPAKEKYKRLVVHDGLSKNFVFTGFVHDYELPFFYGGADLLVTASTFETQGMTIVEAMACGTPVVGADSLAIPETVSDGRNGFLFKPFDEEDCAEKMLKVLSLPEEERRRMAAECVNTARGYTISKCTDRLLEVYKLVL